jgi:drug/metabolite transporter (DMT)-like permease
MIRYSAKYSIIVYTFPFFDHPCEYMELNVAALAALGTAFAWTFTAIAFEYAGKRIGALTLNFLRLAVACLFLGVYGLAVRGSFIPLDAPLPAWLWLGASGLVGFVLGDLFLFQAFIDIGSRLSMLVYATAPVFTAILGFLAFGERLTPLGLGGMALTLAGIAFVVLGKKAPVSAGDPRATAAKATRRTRGILLALLATMGQAGGLVLGKLGAGTGIGAMDPFAGTQVRVLAGILGFAAVLTATGSWRGVGASLKDGKAVASLTAGAFLGPFLGVSLSLLAVQSGNTGVASAIMSIVPVLIIAPSAIVFKERVTPREILGSVVAVGGVFLLFLA